MAEKQPQAEVVADESGSRAGSIHESQTMEEGGLRNRAERIHEFNESEGYLIDITTEDETKASGIQLAKDGHTVLIPQPSDDRNDPLNWSWAKKHLILFVVSFVSFLPDYGSATGAVTLIPQAMYVLVLRMLSVAWNENPADRAKGVEHNTGLCQPFSSRKCLYARGRRRYRWVSGSRRRPEPVD
jgi:hypothetical protein